MANQGQLFCPFCGIDAFTEYEIVLHIEYLHPENGSSPFIVQENNHISNFAVNDVDGGASTSSHIDNSENVLHSQQVAENLDLSPQKIDVFQYLDEDQSELDVPKESTPNNMTASAKVYDKEQEEIVFKPRCLRNHRRLNKKTSPSELVKKTEARPKSESSSKVVSKRLGKSELGPHAHEDKMPGWLIKLLKEEDGMTKKIKKIHNGKLKEIEICPNMISGIIPALVRLLTEDKSTLYAYTCNPCVRHVSRLKREDGFCGYRNIQMMASYIVSTESQGCEVLGKKIPTIFDIQDFIEMAWDLGYNSHGRIETNGIRGTRKYIGTSEAQAMFCGLGIACEVQGITKCKVTNKPACELLLTAAEDYFSRGSINMEPKVRSTYLPPIYLQHQGHSMTIVGFEKRNDGSKNLIVFDPRYYDSLKIMELVDRAPSINIRTENLLGTYRKDIGYLKKFSEFEILKLHCPSI